jgi:hypothetical protein
MYDRMPGKYVEMQAAALRRAGPDAATRPAAASDAKTQALIALFMTGCLPAKTCDWIAGVVRPGL